MEEEITARVADGIRNIFGNSPYLTPEPYLESLIARRMEDEINRIIRQLISRQIRSDPHPGEDQTQAGQTRRLEAARKAIHDAIEAKRKSLLPPRPRSGRGAQDF